jgi:hypothetical protein
MLRHLAAGERGVLIAAVIGILLRCLSRRGGFGSRGRVKSSWISLTFGVDLSGVKKARAQLVELGWIEPELSSPYVEKQYGRAFRIDLDWDRPGRVEGRSLPPVSPAKRPAIATPTVDREPFQERNIYQDPDPGGPAGARPGGLGGRKPEPRQAESATVPDGAMSESDPALKIRSSLGAASASSSVTGPPPKFTTSKPPRLRDIQVEDLKDTDRTLTLFEEATALGWVGSSEADRLRFVSSAEHALAVGERNPAGLFFHLVRENLWRYLTQDEEDRANRRIELFLLGPEKPRTASMFALGFEKQGIGSSSSRPVARLPLSEDARMVERVRSALAAKGYHGDPFPRVSGHDPAWTRERWDRALAELGTRPDGPRMPSPQSPRPVDAMLAMTSACHYC